MTCDLVKPADKPIPLPALDDAEWFDIEVPEDLARDWWERTADGMLSCFHAIETGCGKPGAPHRKSYRPDLPSVSTDASVAAWIRREQAREDKRNAVRMPAVVQASTLAYGADHSGVRKGKAHAQSFGADIPLGGYKPAQYMKPTKDDKAYWLAHPLTYTTARRAPALDSYDEAAD